MMTIICRMFYGGVQESNFSTNELDQISDGPTTRELSSLITVSFYNLNLIIFQLKSNFSIRSTK